MKKNASAVNPILTSPPPVSKIRSRDKALGFILPKFLGLLWERGEPDTLPNSVKALIGQDLEIAGIEIGPVRYIIDAYSLLPSSRAGRVFLANIAIQSVTDGRSLGWGEPCAVLTWKRGVWEDRIVAEQVEPRTIAHVAREGLMRRMHS